MGGGGLDSGLVLGLLGPDMHQYVVLVDFDIIG